MAFSEPPSHFFFPFRGFHSGGFGVVSCVRLGSSLAKTVHHWIPICRECDFDVGWVIVGEGLGMVRAPEGFAFVGEMPHPTSKRSLPGTWTFDLLMFWFIDLLIC